MRSRLRFALPLLMGLAASLVFLPSVKAQGVAPFVSLWLNGAPVSSANPLPVTGGGGGSPSPFPSVVATDCAAAPAYAPNTLSIPAGCQPSPVPSPQVTATACAASPGVSGSVIEIPAGCGGGGGVTFGAGVPTSAPSQSGQLYVATDAQYAGMRTFSYLGSEVGLPYVINRGFLQNAASSGTPAITLERTAIGGLMVAFDEGFGGGNTGAACASGWTGLYNNNGGTVGAGACWKISTAGDTTEAPWTLSGNSSQILAVFEVANANATPIAQSVSGANGIRTSAFTSGQLALVAEGFSSVCAPGYRASGISLGTMQNGSGCVGFSAQPLIPYFVTVGSLINSNTNGGGIVIVDKGAATVNFWVPLN